jgi:hypothetical protein
MQPPRVPAKAKAKATPAPDQDRASSEEAKEATTELSQQPISPQAAAELLAPTLLDSPGTNDATAIQQPPQELPSPADQAQREIKRLEAENKILSDANDSLEGKLAALMEDKAEREHAHTALVAQHQQLVRLIRTAQSASYDIQCYDICAPASGTIDWPRCFGKLLAALRATFMYHDC